MLVYKIFVQNEYSESAALYRIKERREGVVEECGIDYDCQFLQVNVANETNY